MHRSHWVAKPQQSLSSLGRVDLIELSGRRRSSEGDAELMRGGGTGTGLDPPMQHVSSVMAAELTGPTGQTLKRSRATARMTLKKHPRFSSSESSSSASPASSSAESDDLVHGESTDSTVPPRRVPSIQVEPIVEERIVPPGRFLNSQSHLIPSAQEEFTETNISTLEFSVVLVESQPQEQSPSRDNDIATGTCNISDDVPVPGSPDGTAASKFEPADTNSRDITNVPSISTEEISIRYEQSLEADLGHSTDQTDLLQKSQKDSLSVPHLIGGDDAYPKDAPAGTDHPQAFLWVTQVSVGSAQRPLILETKEIGDEPEVPAECFGGSDTGGVAIGEGRRMASLDVPPVITGEVCFPQVMLTGTKELSQYTFDEDQSHGQNAPVRKILKIRPKSLDIPPMLPAPYPESESPSPSTDGGHGVKRKHSNAKSILKRSCSMERPGRKKSVTFSPDVSPREVEVDRFYHGDIDRERKDSPKRPRVFRHFSMDIPDSNIWSEEDTPSRAWSHGDPDEDDDHPDVFSPGIDSGKLSRAEGWVHPSPLEPLQVEGSDARMAFVPICTLESDETGRKSAKERFLEAGGAKAVLFVLCTQDSNDSNGSKYASSPGASKDVPINDGSEEDSMETMPDLDQPLSASSEIDDDSADVIDDNVSLGEEASGEITEKLVKDQIDCKGIKSRFLEYTEDSADLHTSRLFVQTVRSSIESESSDEQDRSPTSKEAKGPDEEETERCAEEEDQATSAKSRFLQSCQEAGEGEYDAGSRFVVSVVRPYSTGSHKQDSPPHDENKEQDTKQAWNRVPGVKSANTWSDPQGQQLGEDIASYESAEPKAIRVDKHTSTPVQRSPSLLGRFTVSIVSESEIDSTAGEISSARHSASYSTSSQRTSSSCENTAVVIDNGSEMLKVGFAGEFQPRYTVPSVVGRFRSGIAPDSASAKREAFVGYDATRRKSLMSFDYPLSEGVVHNWSDLEKIWEYAFTDLLNVAPQDHPVIVSEYASTSKKQREKCLEIFFERLQVPSMCLANQGALALYAHGDTSGIVLSSGGGLTEVIPVLDGCTLQYAVTTLEVAGKQITSHLGRLLQSERGYNLTSPTEMAILKDIKETMAYVCMDMDREKKQVKQEELFEYKLPDGNTLTVGHSELFQCTEPLFQPILGGFVHQSGIHDMIQDTLKRCDPTFLAGINKSILLAGGNTQLRGFGDRLQFELASAHLPWSVSMPQERTNNVWIGGSVLAAHGNFFQRCINVEEYAENGAEIVHRKCF